MYANVKVSMLHASDCVGLAMLLSSHVITSLRAMVMLGDDG